MKSKLLLTIAISWVSLSSLGQSINVGVGYDHLFNRQFDNLIHTYNFSRPFLDEKQPLFSNGFYSGISYIFKSKSKFSSGVKLKYSHFRSTAENEEFNVSFGFNSANIGYFLYHENTGKLKYLYTEFGLNLALGLLNKRVNGEAYIVDDIRVRSLHIGGSIDMNLGYWFVLKNNARISPKIGVSFSPFFSEGTSEVVINETTNLVSEQYNSYLSFSAGLVFNLKR